MNKQPSTDLSFEEKKQAIRNFIVACYHNQIHINTYHRLASFLDDDRITLLFPLRKSGNETNYPHGVAVVKSWFTDTDAEKYFEWLVAVINGTEEVRDGVKKQAYEQLFRILYLMRDDMTRDEHVQLIASYDWQALFSSFDERLTDMQRIIDRGDKDTVDVLKTLLQLVKENKTLLKTLCRENEELFGKKVKS